MPLPASPADFNQQRASIVTLLASCLGLPEGQVIFEEPESMSAPRPKYPYLGVLVLQAAGQSNPDFYLPIQDAPGAPTGMFTYLGERELSITISTFASTHEQAYQAGATLQAMLGQIPTRDAFRAQGLTVRDVGALTNVSQLLNTAYEGRSQLDVTFAYVAKMLVDMGSIAEVPIFGTLTPDDSETFDFKDD